MKVSQKAGIVFIVCALFIGSVSAAGVSIGIKGGLNLARPWDMENESKYITMKPGLITGAALKIGIVDMLSIQPEALYSMKGMRFADGTESFVFRFNYFEVPVLFKLNIPNGTVIPNFYVGPALAFLMNVDGYMVSDAQRESMSVEIADAIRKASSSVDFGLTMGGGLDIPAGNGCVIFDLRYTLGLIPLDKNGDASDKNSALSFMAGYAFTLGGK